MIKRYIHSLIAMKYSFPMTLLSFVIFVFAYLWIERSLPQYRIVVMILGIILGILLAYYYYQKISVSRQLKKVKDVKEFDQAVMIGHIFLLEDRCLCFQGSKIHVSDYQDLKSLTLDDESKMKISLAFDDGSSYSSSLASMKQAQRFGAFLKRKNESVQVVNLTVQGDGELKHVETGA